MRRETGNRMWSVFERRSDLEKILAVAEEGKILAAAERLAISQPALTRAIARLEARFGGRLFERLPTGVRTTPFGDTAAALARGVLREIVAAEEKLHAARTGRAGSFRVTAAPMWMEAVLGPALAGFRERAPGIALTLRAAPFAEGLRLLVRGESDLHCGGADPGDPLPAFLRRERFPDIAAGIVAAEGHPLLDGTPAPALSPGDLAAWPWIDFDPPALDRLLERLFRDTGRRAAAVLRAGAAGLFPMATGPWLAWLPLDYLDRLAWPRLRPLPLAFGRRRCRTGFVARRAAEDLEPFRLLERTLRDSAIERHAPQAG